MVDAADAASAQIGGAGRPDGYPSQKKPPVFAGAVGRLLSLIAALAGLAWVYVAFNATLIDADLSLKQVSHHLLVGESFSTEMLGRVEQEATAAAANFGCDASAWEDLAIIRISLVDAAFESNDAESADRYLSGAKEASERVLACSPGSTLAWTLLAWIELIRNDDSPRLRELVQMSFRTGPFEGWPLLRRLEIMLRLTGPLTDAEKKQLVDQARWLLQFNFWSVLAEFYVTVGDTQKKILYPILAEADQRNQKRIAQYIRERGTSIDLPLVEPEGSRPWR